jgi:hypothetical protein
MLFKSSTTQTVSEAAAALTGYEVGDRLLVGAITPCGQCRGERSDGVQKVAIKP